MTRNNSLLQYDYIGTQPEEAPEIEQRMKALRSASKKPYYTGTSMRHTYTVPKVDSLLQGNTSRYGCNSKKNQVSQSSLHIVFGSPGQASISPQARPALVFSMNYTHYIYGYLLSRKPELMYLLVSFIFFKTLF